MAIRPIRPVMTPKQVANYEFALKHPRRLKIIAVLHGLREGLSFEALRRSTKLSHALLVKHLQFLKDAGLVHLKATGRSRFYKLDSRQFDQLIGPWVFTSPRIAV